MDSLLHATLDYIRANYLTLAEFAKRAGVAPARIGELIEQHCLPAHSYEITEQSVIRSFFGKRDVNHPPERYYGAALVERAQRIEEQSQHTSLPNIAASEKQAFFDRYQELLLAGDAPTNGFGEHFAPDGTLNQSSLAPHLEQEWQHVLDGTYALCTPTSEVEDIVAKELMANKIKRLTEDNTKATLTQAEQAELLKAIRALDKACSQFAPDERAQSSRHHRIDSVLAKYGLRL